MTKIDKLDIYIYLIEKQTNIGNVVINTKYGSKQEGMHPVT